jgi:uncharacterized membrane protein
MTAKDFFSEEQKQRIRKAIEEAENNTSGEIRVHMENTCKGEALDAAADIFKSLKMHETALRNGVLIYLAVKDHKFAILGDKGINEKVPADFWESTRDAMLTEFKAGRFTEGLCTGILQAGEKLKTHFPRNSDDVNELSDDVTFGG